MAGSNSHTIAGTFDYPPAVFVFGDSGSGSGSISGSFESYAAKKLRSFGHIVVSIDEWGTS